MLLINGKGMSVNSPVPTTCRPPTGPASSNLFPLCPPPLPSRAPPAPPQQVVLTPSMFFRTQTPDLMWNSPFSPLTFPFCSRICAGCGLTAIGLAFRRKVRHHQLWKQANHGHPEPQSLYCQLQTHCPWGPSTRSLEGRPGRETEHSGLPPGACLWLPSGTVREQGHWPPPPPLKKHSPPTVEH